MTLAILLFVFLCVLSLVSFVQILYLESLRLRTRDLRALEEFKETVQDRLGYDTEDGAFVFSLIKHTLLILCGVLVLAAVAASYPAPGGLAVLEGFAIAWGVMFVTSYVIPHLLYRRAGALWVIPFLPFYKALGLLFRPLAALIRFLHSLFELAEPTRPDSGPSEPGEHIEALISAGEEEGIIEEEDSRLIQSVVAFGDKRVREVMTPRPSIVAIPADRTLEDLRKLAKNEQYSRIPVYDGPIDHIVGFVHVRDLFDYDTAKGAATSIRDILRPIAAVPETKLVSELLREMQRSGAHIVFVVDEYGNVAGLATMEDLVEEVFGEIRDEHEPMHDIERLDDGSVVVSGSFDVDHLKDLFDYNPEEEFESTTVGGLVSEWLGVVPKPGASVQRHGIQLDVLSSDGLRVDKVRILRIPDPSLSGGENS